MNLKREKVGKLLKQCGVGNRLACAAAKLHVIDAGSVVTFRNVDATDEHPNRQPFKGIVLLTNQPSTKPPHGSQGHRIYVPTDVARKKLRGLVGMAVNYDRVDLDGHASRHKIGVITKAWMDGDKVWVEGFIYKKDFPEAARDLKDRSDLGMSMEFADVYVRDEKETVWHLLDFELTGAAILKKNAAAYFNTTLAARAAVGRKGNTMDPKDKNKKAIAAAAGGGSLEALTQSIVSAVTTAVKADLGELKDTIQAQGERLEQVQSEVTELNGLYVIDAAGKMAAKYEDDDDMEAKSDDDDDDMEAGHKKDEDDEDEDEDDVDAEIEDLEEEPAEEEPGEVNKKRGDKNKGDKTSVTDPPKQGAKVPGNIAEKRLKSGAAAMKAPFPGVKGASLQAAAVKIQEMAASVESANRKARRALKAAAEMAVENKKLGREMEKMAAQMEKAAERETRRSAALPNPVRNLLAKGGVNVASLEASGQKLSVEAVDEVFAEAEKNGVVLQVADRAAMKNIMLQRGLMDSGEINRVQ